MARLAVLASGNGSNFEALVTVLRRRPETEGPRHDCVLLIYDRRIALVAERAARLGIPALYIGYSGRDKTEAEAQIATALDAARVDLTALAGFMRLLSPGFVAARRGRLVNVHPSILPKWPGAHAIERAFEAGESEFGVSVHLVDEGMDTGPIIASATLKIAPRRAVEPGTVLDEIEARVHDLEHEIYPRTVLSLLDAIDEEGRP